MKMGKSWITTLGGLITAAGASLIMSEDHTLRLIGQIFSVLGPLVLGFAAKQVNVTGGSVPQASPPGVALKSNAMGIINAVEAMPKRSYEETRVLEVAKEILAAPPPTPAEVMIKKEGC
jgi:hypothetical protein